MSLANPLDEALALALRLSPRERIQLIERVASSVEQEIDTPAASALPDEGHWGENLVRLLDELGPIELVHPEIDDPTEWVKQIRQDQGSGRNLDWSEGK